MKITYNMTCGCCTSEIIPSKSNMYNTCPDHTEVRVESREVSCKCGVVVVSGPMGKVKGQCPKCAHEAKKARQRKRWHNKKSNPKPRKISPTLLSKMKQASVDQYDCGSRDKCLSEILVKNPLADYLPCHGCRKYKPADLNIDFMDTTYRDVYGDRAAV